LAVVALLAIVCGGAFAQRYTPPGGGSTTGGGGGGGGTDTKPPATTTPPVSTQHNPDPFGLTLAASGAAAAVGYVMRRKREAS
jgi:hypothetical protein